MTHFKTPLTQALRASQVSIFGLALLWMTASKHSYAQNITPATAPSTTITGAIGLNTIPTARMDKIGTMRAGLGFSDIYTHAFIGLQIAAPLSITLRQTAEISDPFDYEADRFYPGIDVKWMMAPETEYSPAIAVGLQSAIGHTRMSGEYIALSKRYKSFDFTAGLGWGRLGSSLTINNPLKSISSHFGGNRALDGEMPAGPEDWFTGEEIGLFGGIEYFTPIKGLSLKADIGGDRFEAEKAAFNYDPTDIWSAGLNYHTDRWKVADIDASIAAHGTDRIMARLSLSQNIANWPDRNANRKANRQALAPNRTNNQPNTSHIEKQAEADNINLQRTSINDQEIHARLTLKGHASTPQQIGDAAIHIANNAGPDIEKITLTPGFLGLEGHSVTIMRRDLENALAFKRGSAQEIWHNADITDNTAINAKKRSRFDDINRGFLPFTLTLDYQFSLAEEDRGILHRTSLISKIFLPRKTGYLDYGAALRLNLSDNLNHLDDFRTKVALPVRSNVDDFANSAISLDQAFTAFTHSVRSDLHVSAMIGYLEEMYGGTGGEILYRPLGKRFTLGAESFLAFKRDPETTLDLGYNGDTVLTAHLNASYDIPRHNINLTGKIGRFLAEDFGAQIGFRKDFKNGARLDGYLTLSDTADFDLFGGTTHADHGLRLTLPLGGVPHMPNYANVSITSSPFGRDIGQSINNPLPLYEVTQPLSLPHLVQHWDDITP